MLVHIVSHKSTNLYCLHFELGELNIFENITEELAELLMHRTILCRSDAFEVNVQIDLIMGQIITRLTGGIQKTDINLDYQTYGEGDTYAIDGNDAYQPSDYDEVEERDEGRSTRRFTPPNSIHPKV